MTLEDWKQKNVTTELGRQSVTTAAYAVWAADPSQLSLLYVLWYIAGSGDSKNRGSLARLVTTQGGTQERRFVGGSQLISQRVAHKLGPRVVLSSPVRSVHQGGNGVTVTSDRLIVHAKQAIVAIPPVLLAGIHFTPELPRLRRNLARRTVPGHLIKWQAIYDRPFWRDAGLSGQVISDVGPARSTFDNSPPGGTPGIMFAFIGGSEADAFAKLSVGERRNVVLGQFVTYFGQQAATPLDSFGMDWSTEPWTRGCPVGVMAPGTLRRFGPALRVPFKRVHWAGSEVSTWWAGYMDGAVRSGETAAREVAKALRRH
jgi:monoamine oxidase